MQIKALYRKAGDHDLSLFDRLFSEKPAELDSQTQAEISSSEMLLREIEIVIQRVDKNQLSAGQGWRAVKRIIQAIIDDDSAQGSF